MIHFCKSVITPVTEVLGLSPHEEESTRLIFCSVFVKIFMEQRQTKNLFFLLKEAELKTQEFQVVPYIKVPVVGIL